LFFNSIGVISRNQKARFKSNRAFFLNNYIPSASIVLNKAF